MIIESVNMKHFAKHAFGAFALLFLSISFSFSQTYYDIEEGTGDHVYSLLFDDPPECLSASPDGNTLLFGMKSEIFLVNFSDGQLKKYIHYRKLMKDQEAEGDIGFVRSITTLAGGSKVAVAGLGGILLMDVNRDKILWTAPGHPTDSVAKPAHPKTNAYRIEVTPDEKWLVSASLDEDSLRTWSTLDGEAGQVIGTNLFKLQKITISPNGKYVAALGDSGIAVFDLAKGEEVWSKKDDMYEGCISFSPDGKYLAAGTDDNGAGVHLISMADPETAIEITGAGEVSLNGIVWTKDSKSIYTASTGQGACPLLKWSWDGKAPKSQVVAEDFMVLVDADHGAVAGSGGRMVALAGDDDELRVYRLK